MLKLSRIDHADDGYLAKYAAKRGAVRVGVIYQRETTKTGFRRGYCVGQVPCKRWFYRLDRNPYVEVGGGSGYTGNGFSTRAAAVAHMSANLPPTPGEE